VTAISQRPWVGWGLGTFPLASKRFQQEKDRYSWFAHSFPLEITVELGIIGLALVGFLIWSVWAGLEKKHEALKISVFLSLIYSIYEMNLSFLVVWLMVWLAVGFLQTPGRKDAPLFFTWIVTGFLVCIYAGSITASIMSAISSLRPYAFYAEPYVLGRAVAKVSDPNTPLEEKNRIARLYAKDVEILAPLAQAHEKVDKDRAMHLYEQAVVADKTNLYSWQMYQEFIATQPAKEVETMLMQYLQLYGPVQFHKVVPLVSDWELEQVTQFLNNKIIVDWRDPRNNFIRIFYGLGLVNLAGDSQRAAMWWTLAQDSAPNWSYIHLELASLALNVFKDESMAQKHLSVCRQNEFAKEHCATQSFARLPAPGFYRKQIQELSILAE
jgi:hypothetical protein